jgi:DNA-binding XRE family transcriptional regulator
MHVSTAEDRAPPGVDELLLRLGARIRLARKRRELRQSDVAELAGVTRFTVRRIEAGCSGTSMGAYVAVLASLHLQHAMERVADPDRDPYEGLPVEIANRIQRVLPAPDLLTFDPAEGEPGLQEMKDAERQAAEARKARRAWIAANPYWRWNA